MYRPVVNSAPTLVDADVAEQVKALGTKLFVNNRGAVYRNVRRGKTQLLSQIVMGKRPRGKQHIDHIDGNRLNNTRANLRWATTSENAANVRKARSASGFKGVSLHRSGRYQARIGYRGETRHLGVFKTPEAAAVAYDLAARKLFGSFAWSNAPETLRGLDPREVDARLSSASTAGGGR